MWPEVFQTGILNTTDKREACAWGLCGWAMAHLAKAPEKFGQGMIAIGDLLGIPASPEGLTAYSERLLEEGEVQTC